jgi:hypothetical protein
MPLHAVIVGQVAGGAQENTTHVHELAEGKVTRQCTDQHQVNQEDYAQPVGYDRMESGQGAGFPLSRRLGGCGRLTKPDISLATKSGHFNLLTTSQNSLRVVST